MDEPENITLFTKDELREKFDHAANYVIFAGMLLISAVIGVIFCIKGQRNTEEFLMASRKSQHICMKFKNSF